MVPSMLDVVSRSTADPFPRTVEGCLALQTPPLFDLPSSARLIKRWLQAERVGAGVNKQGQFTIYPKWL